MNRQYLDPVFLGSYPDEMKEIFGDAWPEWPAEDFELICERIDFVGVNYYMRDVIRHDEQKWPVKTAVVAQPLSTYTETGWEVYRRASPRSSSGSSIATAMSRFT